jgi:hypothetical protein
MRLTSTLFIPRSKSSSSTSTDRRPARNSHVALLQIDGLLQERLEGGEVEFARRLPKVAASDATRVISPRSSVGFRRPVVVKRVARIRLASSDSYGSDHSP